MMATCIKVQSLHDSMEMQRFGLLSLLVFSMTFPALPLMKSPKQISCTFWLWHELGHLQVQSPFQNNMGSTVPAAGNAQWAICLGATDGLHLILLNGRLHCCVSEKINSNLRHAACLTLSLTNAGAMRSC